MRAATVLGLVLSCIVAGGGSCGGDGKSAQCQRPALNDGSVTACRAARAVVLCPTPFGGACGCVTDGLTCPECPGEPQVSSGEYAVECGGSSAADAGPIVVFDDPPPGCTPVADGVGGTTVYCCPCQ